MNLYPTKAIIFSIIGGLLDVVPSYYGCFSVVIVAFICCEIDLSEELLLVVFEFSNHLVVVVVVVLDEIDIGGEKYKLF